MEIIEPTENNISITIISFTENVSLGSITKLTIKTEPDTLCGILYTTPSGNLSDAEGLSIITSNKNNLCSWDWKINPKTKTRTRKVYIYVNDVNINKTLRINIQ